MCLQEIRVPARQTGSARPASGCSWPLIERYQCALRYRDDVPAAAEPALDPPIASSPPGILRGWLVLMIFWERFVRVLAGGFRNLPGSSSFPSVVLSSSADIRCPLFPSLLFGEVGKDASKVRLLGYHLPLFARIDLCLAPLFGSDLRGEE
jgi:hypothetical protein